MNDWHLGIEQMVLRTFQSFGTLMSEIRLLNVLLLVLLVANWEQVLIPLYLSGFTDDRQGYNSTTVVATVPATDGTQLSGC